MIDCFQLRWPGCKSFSVPLMRMYERRFANPQQTYFKHIIERYYPEFGVCWPYGAGPCHCMRNSNLPNTSHVAGRGTNSCDCNAAQELTELMHTISLRVAGYSEGTDSQSHSNLQGLPLTPHSARITSRELFTPGTRHTRRVRMVSFAPLS